MLRFLMVIPAIANKVWWPCAQKGNGGIEVKQLDFAPLPPKVGKPLEVTLDAVVKGKLSHGSVFVNVGALPLHFKICDLAKQVDKTCPIEGEVKIHQNFQIPDMIAPGHYHGTVRVTDSDSIMPIFGNLLLCFHFAIDLVHDEAPEAAFVF